MEYFQHNLTATQLHDEYRAWAKKLHPDAGGDAAAFREMQQEYEERLNELAAEAKRDGSLDDYILIAKFLLELTKRKNPAFHEKVVSGAKDIGFILDMMGTKQAQMLNNVIKSILDENK